MNARRLLALLPMAVAAIAAVMFLDAGSVERAGRDV